MMGDTPEYDEITIEPGYSTNDPLKGADRDERPVKFRGRELASGSNAGIDDSRGTEWTVYEVEDGSIVVQTYSWSRWQGEGSRRTVDTYQDVQDLRDATIEDLPADAPPIPVIPEGLMVDVERELGLDPARYIGKASEARFPDMVATKAPAGTNEALEAIAEHEKCEKSDVIRKALTEFIPKHLPG